MLTLLQCPRVQPLPRQMRARPSVPMTQPFPQRQPLIKGAFHVKTADVASSPFPSDPSTRSGEKLGSREQKEGVVEEPPTSCTVLRGLPCWVGSRCVESSAGTNTPSMMTPAALLPTDSLWGACPRARLQPQSTLEKAELQKQHTRQWLPGCGVAGR